MILALNNNTATLSARTGILFPKHLTDEVCTYLIVADGYFDFRGRAGLIQKLKEFVPDGHYLLRAVSDEKYRTALDRVSVLRNYAAHGSQVAKNRAKETLKLKKLSSAGAWVSKQGRFDAIASKLLALSKDIHAEARY